MSEITDLVGAAPSDGLSLVRGIPLADEEGMGGLTIPAFLSEVCARYGDAEALVMNSGDVRMSYSYNELWARSSQVAKSLIASGLGKGERVGILMTNRPEFIFALFGTALAGGVATALSTFSTREELAYLLATSEISVLLFEERILAKDFRAMLCELDVGILSAEPGEYAHARWPYLRKLVALGGIADPPRKAAAEGAIVSWPEFTAQGVDVADELVLARAATVTPTDVGGIFFSSGTTSLPKGIIHSQRAFAIQWWRWRRVFVMKEPVRSWTGNGFFWSGNVSMVVGTALATGGAVILQRFFKEEEALRLMQAERVSFANGRPHQWARLQAAPNWTHADLSSLKYVPRGELLYEHPTVHTDWRVPMSFGTTETMTICTALAATTSEAQYKGSYGVPLPGNSLKIIDQSTGAIVPVGEHGEMCIKGPTLMSAYLGKAPECCFDDEGYYRTGDGGHLDADGRFYWDGRLTNMIKTGGANVSPEEVDDVIAAYPGIKRSQTIGVEDDLLGEMVVACIVPVDGHHVELEELTAFCREALASFKVPRRFLICNDDDFALTGNEKIKVADIRAMAKAKMACC